MGLAVERRHGHGGDTCELRCPFVVGASPVLLHTYGPGGRDIYLPRFVAYPARPTCFCSCVCEVVYLFVWEPPWYHHPCEGNDRPGVMMSRPRAQGP